MKDCAEAPCIRPECEAPNHCPICGVHHPVDSMVDWCIEHKGQA